MSDDMQEWAEDHGYERALCPHCKSVYYSDSREPCPNGCDDRKPSEEYDEEQSQ